MAGGHRDSSSGTGGQRTDGGRGGRPRHPQRPPASRGTRILRVVLALVGVAGAIGVIDLFWPRPDSGLSSQDQAGGETRLADLPSRPITLLLIGSDADRLRAASNGAAPPGAPNSDTLLLVRVDPTKGLRVLNLPTELAVKLPGQNSLKSLGSLYRQGGVALAADAVAELVGLEPGQPERYAVLSRSALRELVDGMGGVELSPERPMRYTDKAQNYSIDLQSGLQVLKGAQVEQMVRFRDTANGDQGRRDRQQQVVTGLLQQLARADQWPQLAERWDRLSAQLDTNLSQAEALSLVAAVLPHTQKIRYDKVPLKAPTKPDQTLRQLEAGAPTPLWPRS